ncbi:hypothetical protein Pmani_004088 [Petrolisthes manimaculis]|uniref:Uncharacterized protein n=1 Tax=Petrolisthes manimaculis TaxID=1843537 RepID=A0AAE1QEZ8_9EUCA|nr:hypothetical protein Pmani_004088 [Petrolisthes manimaculis]
MATYLPDMMIGEEGGVGGGEVLEDIFLDTPIEGAPLTAGNSSFINDVIKDVQVFIFIASVPGEIRQVQQFDVRLNILAEATVDILFSKNLTPEQFDPTSVTADCINVDLRITKPSEIKLYGSVLRMFINLKVS